MKVCLPEEVIFLEGEWKFAYLKKSYFSRAKPERNMTSEGKQSFISPYNKGHKCIVPIQFVKIIYPTYLHYWNRMVFIKYNTSIVCVN